MFGRNYCLKCSIFDDICSYLDIGTDSIGILKFASYKLVDPPHNKKVNKQLAKNIVFIWKIVSDLVCRVSHPVS